jgi:nucleoside-diphosphate-sugar epimerase
MQGKKRVLVTGMSGLIGGVVRKQLEGRYELVALNRRPVEEEEGVECYQADIADLDAIVPAFHGVDSVVHLAAEASEDSSWQTYRDSNIVGTFNVFEASRMSGVKRIVYASSGATIKGVERLPPYDAIVAGRYDQAPEAWEKVTDLSTPRPISVYGCTKLWGEALARMYSDLHGISAICIRIGHVNREDRPMGTRDFSVWCSQRDIGRLIERCLDAPESLMFDIFYAVSNNRWSYRDMEHARDVLGFVPMDSADSFR